MKFPLSPGEYLFITGLIYFIVGMYDIFVDRFVEPEYLQLTWILVLMIPVIIPMKRIVRNTPFWRTHD